MIAINVKLLIYFEIFFNYNVFCMEQKENKKLYFKILNKEKLDSLKINEKKFYQNYMCKNQNNINDFEFSPSLDILDDQIVLYLYDKKKLLAYILAESKYEYKNINNNIDLGIFTYITNNLENFNFFDNIEAIYFESYKDYEENEELCKWEIIRFAVACKEQNKGYGFICFYKMIKYLFKIFNPKKIILQDLSIEMNNKNFYKDNFYFQESNNNDNEKFLTNNKFYENKDCLKKKFILKLGNSIIEEE